jgi:peptidoglycan hydrolase-like protein with peptidoglycan-binding domain
LRFPIWIGQTVNWGSKNETDVKIIQRALNLFPATEGGPKPKLKVDGIYGPKTNAAIVKFQQKNLGFADGKVDPGKATINKINEMEPIWLTMPPELIDRIYKVTMPTVLQCAVAANKTIEAARNSIISGKWDVTDDNAASVALVLKHFALDRNPAKDHDFEVIAAIFRDMVSVAADNLFGSAAEPRTFVAFPGRFTFSWAYSSTNTANAVSNGVNLAGQGGQAEADDGTPFTLQYDKILVVYPYIRCTADAEICSLLHEMAHFVGPDDNSLDTINDQDGGYGPPARISHLSPEKRVRNAETYSNFAFEANFKREPINGII